MENTNENQQIPAKTDLNKKEKKSFMRGIGGKLLFIAINITVLLIGLQFIKCQLSDREDTYRSAKWDISESAGGICDIGGPYLAIPYTTSWVELVYRDSRQYSEPRTKSGYILISANNLNIDTILDSDIRTVGIYSSPIFTGTADIYSTFNIELPEDTDDTTYNPEKALLCVDINSSSLMKGPVFDINNATYSTDLYQINGNWMIGTKYPAKKEKLIFKTKLNIRGADKFQCTTSAKDTKVTLKSDWVSPGFTGFSCLPDKRELSKNGFSAEWHVPFGNGNFDQTIGMSFIEPVNLYQKLHRAIKYGFLFIIVPFLVLFFFEIFAKIILHPVHYLLSGTANVLFFLLLLALSEHIPFSLSYIIAGLVASITVSIYISSVTKKFKLGSILLGVFAILYSYLYISLKSEDYALLLGAVFAFIILIVIMFSTRKIDWYNLKKTSSNKQ